MVVAGAAPMEITVPSRGAISQGPPTTMWLSDKEAGAEEHEGRTCFHTRWPWGPSDKPEDSFQPYNQKEYKLPQFYI